ncbi:hypothetical protein FACS1894172_18630 [Spirochaetia bacterium]|nr:hypothetical protein FACS1894164_19990 [Spirochaetia bacterium]GHU36098.1 hypothetical protein FACS1894172_18630 [Spirochaetia bacterium]
MRIPKVYLETTIFNFCFVDDAPDKKYDTLQFFKEINEGKYIPYTSDYALQELKRASDEKQNLMLPLIEKYKEEL